MTATARPRYTCGHLEKAGKRLCPLCCKHQRELLDRHYRCVLNRTMVLTKAAGGFEREMALNATVLDLHAKLDALLRHFRVEYPEPYPVGKRETHDH